MTNVPRRDHRGLPLSRVVPALAVIALLAIVVPYTLVSRLHERRIGTADRDLAAIAAGLGSVPTANGILLGRGLAPVFVDAAWTASSGPLARVSEDPGPDPWGNAYVAAVANGLATIVTAGPDGVLQTSPLAEAPLGDDRLARARPSSR